MAQMNEGRQVKIGEFLGRVGIVLFFTIVATLKGISIAQLLAGSTVTPADNWLLVLLSNFASLVYLCLVIAVAVFRLKPSRGAQGIEPRVTAMAATFLMLPLALLPLGNTPPATAAVIALCLVGLGSALSAYVLIWLGRSFSIMAEARRLVTRGPYAIVRHPLYLTEAIATIGMVVLNWSLIAVLLAAVLWALQLRRVRHEENVLQAAFPEYASYAARTPRWLPALPGRQRQPV
ncbi:MAG: isoprenylcysteine carboxylmethyltransferase family protein [Alphaproteobacteria bacterium]|nr:MAG: isoprenylcysteine carboxylmethyltransferase family protein [Alphaproteobacteria bacterium]